VISPLLVSVKVILNFVCHVCEVQTLPQQRVPLLAQKIFLSHSQPTKMFPHHHHHQGFPGAKASLQAKNQSPNSFTQFLPPNYRDMKMVFYLENALCVVRVHIFWQLVWFSGSVLYNRFSFEIIRAMRLSFGFGGPGFGGPGFGGGGSGGPGNFGKCLIFPFLTPIFGSPRTQK